MEAHVVEIHLAVDRSDDRGRIAVYPAHAGACGRLHGNRFALDLRGKDGCLIRSHRRTTGASDELAQILGYPKAWKRESQRLAQLGLSRAFAADYGDFQ